MKMSTCVNFERFLACKLGEGGLCQFKLMYTQLISAEIKLGLTSFFSSASNGFLCGKYRCTHVP